VSLNGRSFKRLELLSTLIAVALQDDWHLSIYSALQRTLPAYTHTLKITLLCANTDVSVEIRAI
jgi:hypothetical protein